MAEQRDHAGWGLAEYEGGVLQSAKIALHIGFYPLRSRMALYVVREGRSYPLAYFRSPDAAREAMDLLDMFMDPQEEVPAESGT
jgi:hypothetical protein